jgi:putative endonuclease
MARSFCVYILASRSRNLYVGVTNNLARRLIEHRGGKVKGFTTRYGIHRLVHFEPYEDVRYAIAREKEIKAWRREEKIALIECGNPTWDDLSRHPQRMQEGRTADPSSVLLRRDDERKA